MNNKRKIPVTYYTVAACSKMKSNDIGRNYGKINIEGEGPNPVTFLIIHYFCQRNNGLFGSVIHVRSRNFNTAASGFCGVIPGAFFRNIITSPWFFIKACVKIIADYAVSLDRRKTYTERLGFGLRLPKDMKFSWYRRGGESYRDRYGACLTGIYDTMAMEQHFPFIRPTENSGHEDTRWIDFPAFKVSAESPFHFDARAYSIRALLNATHEHELIKEDAVYLNLDIAHAGIGGDLTANNFAETDVIKPGATYGGRFRIAIK